MALNTISYLTSWLNVPSFCGSLPDCLLILRLPPSTGAGSSKNNNLNCSKITVCSGSVGVGWKRKTRCSKLRSRWDARKWRRKVSWEETDVIRIGGSWESRAEGPEECWWGQVIQRQVENLFICFLSLHLWSSLRLWLSSGCLSFFSPSPSLSLLLSLNIWGCDYYFCSEKNPNKGKDINTETVAYV